MVLNYATTTILPTRKKRQNLLSKKKRSYENDIESGKHHTTVTIMKLAMMMEMKNYWEEALQPIIRRSNRQRIPYQKYYNENFRPYLNKELN